MSSGVKRWDTDDKMYPEHDGRFVLASDYERLEAVCRELIDKGRMLNGSLPPVASWIETETKARALLGGGAKTEGGGAC